MDSKPTLQEFLAAYPHKTAHDYYTLYGQQQQEDNDDIFEFLQPNPTPPPTPPVETTPYHEPFFVQKKKAKLDVINIIAAVLGIVGFFLPWADIRSFKDSIAESYSNGWTIPETYSAFQLTEFSPMVSFTPYIILIGSLLTLVAGFLRWWDCRIIGQIFFICFTGLWAYILYSLYSNPDIAPKDLELFSYFQYGFYLLLLALVLYLVSIIRTTATSRK